MNSKFDGMLGLAAKAGKIIFGSEMSAEAARHKKAYLVVLATDASDRTKKLIRNKTTSFDVPLAEYGNIEHLAKILGKARVSCIAVSDEGFAKAMLKILWG